MEREWKEILSLAKDYWLALHCKGVWDQKEKIENDAVISNFLTSTIPLK